VPEPDGVSIIQQLVTNLLNQVSPTSAEAKVLPRDPFAADLVSTVQEGRQLPPSFGETNPLVRGNFDPVKKQIYQQVLRTAQARPETVGVSYSTETPHVGDFDPNTDEIRVRPRPLSTDATYYAKAPATSMPPQETLAHELMHFLMKVMPPELLKAGAAAYPERQSANFFQRLFMSPLPGKGDAHDAFTMEGQHELIKYLLGGDKAPGSLDEYAQQVPMSQLPSSSLAAASLYQALLRQIFAGHPLEQLAVSGVK
jgi:hypothetical protein